MHSALPKAACVFMLREDHVLSVSRRNDAARWGIPGGKVDPGESVLQAALRETMEEVGYQLQAADLTTLFVGVCGGDKEGEQAYEVTTFLCKAPAPELTVLQPEQGLMVAYRPVTDLLCPDVSPFAEYHKQAATALLQEHFAH